MAKYEMKFMFDWGSGTCVWSINNEANARYDYPVMIDDLPISQELKNKLEAAIEKHDNALNWSDSAANLLWNEGSNRAFQTRSG